MRGIGRSREDTSRRSPRPPRPRTPASSPTPTTPSGGPLPSSLARSLSTLRSSPARFYTVKYGNAWVKPPEA